jgi:acyclic terpene utilization AtuA family protein
VAGHLIECGTQACGGFSTDWLDLPENGNIGFPVVEISEDGSCVVTKPPGTGGAVNLRTVKEQLLYEVGDPGKYLSPDATVSFLDLSAEEIGKDRVAVRGAKGRAPTSQYKVSATYRDGFKAHATITIFGRNAVAKARCAGENILRQLERDGITFDRSLVECLGSGASVAGVKIDNSGDNLMETVLRVSVADTRREAIEHFTKKIASLVTADPQGVTGYSGGRSKVQAVFGYWPCLIDKNLVQPKVDMHSSIEATADSDHPSGASATLN